MDLYTQYANNFLNRILQLKGINYDTMLEQQKYEDTFLDPETITEQVLGDFSVQSDKIIAQLYQDQYKLNMKQYYKTLPNIFMHDYFPNLDFNDMLQYNDMVNNDTYNQIENLQDRFDIFEQEFKQVNCDFQEGYILPSFENEIEDYQLENDKDGQYLTSQQQNILKINLQDTDEYTIYIRNHNQENVYKINSKFFIFFDEDGIDQNIKIYNSNNVLVIVEEVELYNETDFQESYIYQIHRPYNNKFLKVTLNHDNYLEGQGVQSYQKIDDTVQILDKTLEQEINEFVTDNDYDFILQKNSSVFGEYSYDSSLDVYYTYQLFDTEPEQNELFQFDFMYIINTYSSNNIKTYKYLYKVMFDNPSDIDSLVQDKYQTLNKNKLEQEIHRADPVYYRADTGLPVQFSKTQFQGGRTGLTPLDSVMYRSRIFNESQLTQIDLTDLLDKKRISVNSDEFKINVDDFINVQSQIVFTQVNISYMDDTGATQNDIFYSYIKPNTIVDTTDDNGNIYWNFPIYITENDYKKIKHLQDTTTVNIHDIQIYVSKTEYLIEHDTEEYVTLGNLKQPISRVVILPLGDIDVNIEYQGIEYGNIIDLSKVHVPLNQEFDFLVRTGDVQGQKYMIFYEPQKSFYLGRKLDQLSQMDKEFYFEGNLNNDLQSGVYNVVEDNIQESKIDLSSLIDYSNLYDDSQPVNDYISKNDYDTYFKTTTTFNYNVYLDEFEVYDGVEQTTDYTYKSQPKNVYQTFKDGEYNSKSDYVRPDQNTFKPFYTETENVMQFQQDISSGTTSCIQYDTQQSQIFDITIVGGTDIQLHSIFTILDDSGFEVSNPTIPYSSQETLNVYLYYGEEQDVYLEIYNGNNSMKYKINGLYQQIDYVEFTDITKYYNLLSKGVKLYLDEDFDLKDNYVDVYHYLTPKQDITRGQMYQLKTYLLSYKY